MKKITIAIDGFSSCGKSTMAKDLAKEIGYIYVDTGAMYRSVTLYALRHNLFNADGTITDQKVVRGVNEDLDAEALRVISHMPKWKPGLDKGKPCRTLFAIPIVFKL